MTVKTIGRGIAGVVLMFSIGAGLGFDGGWTATARQFLFDSFQRVKPRQITRLPAVIIDVDERALEEFGQWPWPRTLTARLVEALVFWNLWPSRSTSSCRKPIDCPQQMLRRYIRVLLTLDVRRWPSCPLTTKCWEIP